MKCAARRLFFHEWRFTCPAKLPDAAFRVLFEGLVRLWTDAAFPPALSGCLLLRPATFGGLFFGHKSLLNGP